MDMQRRLLITVCQKYYIENMTQQQIAAALDISRMKVSRLLQKAKEQEVVRIIIDYAGSFIEQERLITKKYGLKETIIVDGSLGNDTKNLVASAAAYYLENNLPKGTVIAVGWGATMCKVPLFLQDLSQLDLLFTPIIGGHGQSELDMHATTIASNLAKRSGCRSLSLLAPALVKTVAEKQILLNDSQIREVLSKSRGADYALFSLGSPLAKDSSLSKSGYLSEEDLFQLESERTICDVVSIAFLDDNHKVCCTNITDRTISITIDELQKIPTKICIVEGKEKHKAVKAALDAGYIDVLITDEETAQFLDAL
ncbi:sugar-binding transcriptional regulator [Lacrimispora sp.]|uniref:sugar-binding transcriptional regulator n=1 Tax=Lacrimispora sp. TaxID=2719234 RepID=UPI0028A7C529|nr:sugar-binding domain-containing protein [Lacrimispora sp.]